MPTDFRTRLDRAGLLDRNPQDAAIGDLCREYQADVASSLPRPDGSRRVTLRRHDDDTPVCRAIVTRDGQVRIDVTEVIA